MWVLPLLVTGANVLYALLGRRLPAARLKLKVVDHRTHRDVFQLQGVARGDVSLRPGDDRVTDLQVLGKDDVALLTVHIVD